MPAKVVVQNVYSRIYGDVPNEIIEKLDETLQYKVQDYRYIIEAEGKKAAFLAKKNPNIIYKEWDGVVHLFWKNQGNLFYTGMMSEVLKILDESGLEYTIDDRRIIPPRNLADMKLILPAGKFERPYQNIVVASMIKATRGVIQAATGSGKTFMVTKIIGSIKSGPFLFFVPTKDIMDQAHECLSACLTVPIGRIGDGQCDIQQINVVMIQTAIKAIKRNDPKFKISDYVFDEEDEWDKTPLEEDKAVAIDSLIRSAKGIYLDECVCGSTKIITEKGIINISDVLVSGCKLVMTYCDGKVSFKPITKWWNKGKRETIIVSLSNGKKIQCTPEHLIGTKRGWIQAKNLTRKDYILCSRALADAVNWSKKTKEEKISNTFLDTKIRGKGEIGKSGKLNIKNIYQKPLNVNVDAEDLSPQEVKRLIYSLKIREKEVFLNTYTDMINNEIGNNITLNQQFKKNKLYLEHVLEILASFFQTQDLKIEDYVQITGLFNSIGLTTKLNFFIDLILKLKSQKTQDMVNFGFQCGQNAYHLSQKSQTLFILEEKKGSRRKHLTNLEMLDLPGGFVMTEVIADNICLFRFIHKDGKSKIMKSQKNGLAKMECRVKCHFQKEDHTYYSASNHLSFLNQKLNHIFQNVCNTSWATVINIEKSEMTDVYDIEVQDSHAFFANEIFVHNCHHASSLSCRTIMTAATSAYWRYGGSATPFREDGAEMMIQALFGKVVSKISASWLIRNKYLVKPYIFNIRMDGMHGFWKTYHQTYKNYIAENEELNQLVTKITLKMKQLNIPTLILVQQYPQGNSIKKMIPDIPFIRGDTPRKKRRDMISSLRDGTVPYAVATSLADEGLDVERLGSVIIAGGGKSITRVYQRVGRALRSFKGKEKAIVFLFHHEARFLSSHGKRVVKILKAEPEFVIIDTDEGRILDDIDELLKPDQVGIFEQ